MEDPRIFQKSRSQLKIIGTRRVTWRKYHSEDPRTPGCTVQKSAARAKWCLASTHWSTGMQRGGW